MDDAPQGELSTEAFRTLFDLAPDTYYILDFDGVFVMANKAAEEMSGYKREEVLGKNLRDSNLLIPVDVTKAFVNLGKNVLGMPTGPDEYKLQKKDGTIITIAAKTVPVTISGKRYVLGIARDISDQKKLLDQIEEKEKRFQGLFEEMTSGCAIYSTADQGKTFVIRDFNKAAEKIENVTKNEVLGKDVVQVFPGVVEFGLLTAFEQVYTTGLPTDLPLKFYKDDRISGWRENHIYKLPSGDIVAIYNDVTSQKRAEEKIFEDQKRYKGFLERLGGIAYESTSDGHLLMLMGAVTDITGYTEFEVLSLTQNLHDLIVEEDLERMKGHTNTTGTSEEEYRIKRKDGEIRWLHEYRQYSTDEHGTLNKVRGVVYDITERKKLELTVKKHIDELETFQKVSVDRELKMVELKKRIEELETKLQQYEPSTSS